MQRMQTEFLGDYAIVKVLGEGMLGRVYLAQHRFLKKLFVLKVFPDELSQNPDFIRRFEREIALVGRLDHPNIINVHNVSSIEGKYFLVTDAVVDANGKSTNLSQFLEKKGPLAEEEVFEIACQIASAFDYAHMKNFGDEPLVHRALKFNNVLVTSSQGKITIKIGDFGLSRIIGVGAVLSRTYLTLWQEFLLKAGYDREDLSLEFYGKGEGDGEKLSESFNQYYAFLAPELKKATVTSRDLDAKGDTYSFGVMLYYLLCGFFPEGIFPMPSEKNPQLKRDWDGLIRKCLSIYPEERPFRLLELLQDMEDTSILKPKLKPQELSPPEHDPEPTVVLQKDKSVAIYTPKKPDAKDIVPLLTEMVVIEGGTFSRGSDHGARDEMPHHQIYLSSFAIDIHPVTNEQFIRFLNALGGEKDRENHDIIRYRDSRIRKNGGKLSIESGYAKHPVVGVTWYGATAYAKWIGKRLPTEAEWEIAAYGGLDGIQYPTGEKIERSKANFFSSDTTSVKSYPPNSYGLYDMAGNVYEWCLDWYRYNYYEISRNNPDNPQGPKQGVYRVLRGGCWKSLKEDLRCSHRHRNNPGAVNGTYGFRCAADVS